MKTFGKTLFGMLAAALIAGGIFIAYSLYQNNRDVDMPQAGELQSSLDRAVDWLHNNRQTIMQQHNPALWWMLKEASDIHPSPRLRDFYQQYKTAYLDKQRRNIWTPYFIPGYRPYVPDIVELDRLHPYQLFFIYALSCDADLETEAVIRQQFQADFCGMHFLQPRCTTHQLMGVRLLQQRNCGQHEQLAAQLLDTIETELTWDFRVTDSYLQRALMLAESGQYARIKPVWIQRILQAQMPDGGWSDFDPIIDIGRLSPGFTSTLPRIGAKPSDFHASAQGIWLMALLLQAQ